MSDSPYKFLSFYDFTEEDARLFFGRERETQILLSDILVARLVVLFAETGTGKTSLINAGVRPRLEEREYKTFLVRVLEDPIQSTRAELSSHPEVPALRGRTLAEQLLNLSKDLKTPLVIFFDQFEEFFISTFRENRARAEAFIGDIAQLYENPEAGVHIVFSLREDWFVEMDHFRDEIPTIFHNDSNLRLRWFDKKQAREAIRGPASAVEVTIEPRLIIQITRDLLLKDRGIEPAQLQIVCDALWKDHNGNLITLKGDYARLGQRRGEANIAKQILDQHFDNIFSAIQSDQLSLLERLLPLLRTERNTKFARDFDTLVERLETDPDSLMPLLKHLEDAQLLRRSRREGLTMIELAHDYLAPQVTNLLARVQAIALRRLLRNGMQRARERDVARQQQIASSSVAARVDDPIDAHFLPATEFEAITRGSKVLGDLDRAETKFLFEAALEHGNDLITWFNKAHDNGIDVWGMLEQKITDPEALIVQVDNAVRLLGMLRTEQSLKLLEVALRQIESAPRAVDVLAELNTPEAMQLMVTALREGKAVNEVLEKLGELRTMEAVTVLTEFLGNPKQAERAASALERISTGRASEIATRAKEVVDKWRTRQIKVQPTTNREDPLGYEMAPSPVRRWVTASAESRLTVSDWEILLRRIADGKCLPVLGTGFYGTRGLPLISELAHVWAKEFDYPFDDTDDLKQVAQFVATQVEDAIYPKDELCERINRSPAPDFASSSQPYRILADLPLPIFLTTTYDDFMMQALKAVMKDPRLEICAWNRFLRRSRTERIDHVPSLATPMVFHLWGHVTSPESLVVTEDDRLDFLANLSADYDLIPVRIQEALSSSLLLFLGYRSNEPDLPFMLRSLSRVLQVSSNRANIAVQLLVVSDQASEERVVKSQKYLNQYFESQRVRVFWGTTDEFLVELRERWEAKYGTES